MGRVVRLGRSPLPVGELPQDRSSVPIAVRLETDAPVDDIQIDLRDGGRVFVQVKSGVSVSKSDPTFNSVIGQFSAAVKELHLDIRRDRLVPAVARKTGPLDSLFLAWQRSKTSLAGQPTERERKALAIVDELTPMLNATERETLRKVACGFEFTADSEITAQSVLASAVVAPSDAFRAYRELKAISRDLAKHRLGLRIEKWAERLVRVKIVLTCDPNGPDAARWEARRRAVRRYRADLIRLSQSQQKRLQTLAFEDAPVGYVCMHCGTVNPADLTSCTKMQPCRPGAKGGGPENNDPGSTSKFDDDED